MKIQKKKFFFCFFFVFFLGGGGSGGGVGLGGEDGCERRIEVFVNIPKKLGASGGVGLGVRVDVNEELKFL